MATVNKILLPRRGTKAAMENETKSKIVLESGELFIECSNAGVGKGHSKIKIGDGVTAYASLPYAIGDTSNDGIIYDESSANNVVDIIDNKMGSGSTVASLIGSIKKCIRLINTKLTNTSNTVDNITASNTVKYVKIVSSLPADAADHPDTVYLIVE